jgi:hypothetical protein
MNEPGDISRLLVLRKITRAVADLLVQELKSHLATLAPLLQPRQVFGQHLRGSEKQPVKGDAEAFEELRSLYQTLAARGTWSLPKQLESPVDILASPLELAPAEYPYQVPAGQQTKTVQVTSPLKWVLAFSGFGPKRLQELASGPGRATGNELQQCVLQLLVLHVTLSHRPGIVRLLEALRFPVTTGALAEADDLPIRYVAGPISTLRLPDDVIVQSTELSGRDVFEEVVNVDALAQLRDPLRDRLVELVRSHDKSLLPTGE